MDAAQIVVRDIEGHRSAAVFQPLAETVAQPRKPLRPHTDRQVATLNVASRNLRRTPLTSILEAFVAKEIQPWVKTFPNEYYAQLFLLRGLDYDASSVKRPQYFCTLTNDIVYKRLAPGVLSELKKVIPKNEKGRRKAALSQALTRNMGYPKLREHLGATVAFMKISRDYHDFIRKMDDYYPRYGEQYRLPFDYEPDRDDGKGL